MRTRFPCTDYSISNAFPATDFLRLPLSHLPPIVSSGFKGLPRFDQLSILGIDIGINQLPIEKALSKLLSECLPNFIDVDVDVLLSDKPARSKEVDSRELTSSNSNQNEQEGSIPVHGKQDTKFDILRFEIPELDSVLLPAEDSRILPDISFVEKKEIPRTETTLQYPLYIPQSLYAVDEIHLPTFEEKNVNYLEDSGFIQGQYLSHTTQFPLLEVDGAGLGIASEMPIKNEFQIFTSIKIHSMEGDGLSDSEGLLGGTGVDLLVCASNHCLVAKQIEVKMPFPTDYLETDILSVIEEIENSHNGSSCLRNSIIFEEPQYFDLGPHFCEALFNAKLQVEEENPQEAMIVRSFDELIVREELTMTDSFFKSLPVPVCLDREISRSLHSYVEGILVGLDTKQLFASDGLYLDWHILEEVNRYCNEDSLFSKILGDAYNIDTALELGDSELLVYTFIFSGDSPKTSMKDESKETLHINLNDTPEYRPLGENSSSTLQIDSNKGASTDGDSYNTVSQKISSLGVPFSPFNDLNLLNQQAFSNGKEHKLTDQLSDFDIVDMNNSESQKKDQHYLSSLTESHKVEKQWRCMAVEKKHDSGYIETFGGDEVCSMMLPKCEPFDRSKRLHTSDCSVTEAIIVVNTQDFDKQMIISRIKTYQNILSLEKKGAQVIERDFHHPVDVIVSASICIAWYNSRNIARKATASDEAFSSLPLCLENIATSILTSLSFAFDGFILVFEGESSFLDGIMELSDQLYAAAPSLGIDMQIFCSFSPEMTEKIIISCIEAESTKNRGMLPKMPESETLAESFLTMFPSINPLSAQAIVSSVSMLLEFLEWSHERRVHAVQKYGVSYDSIWLLSALSRYGEREESKSGMTDCSSVSSVFGSESLHFGSDSARKKRKYAGYLHDLEDSYPCASDPYLSQNPKKTTTYNGPGMPSLSFDNFFFQHLGLETNMITNRQTSSQYYDYLTERDPEMGDQMNKTDLTPSGVCFPPRQPLARSIINEFDGQGSKDSRNKNKTFIDASEAIDIEFSHANSKKNYTADFKSFSPLLSEVDQDLRPRVPRAAKRLYFDTNNLPSFPTDIDIDSSSYDWTSISHRGQSPGERSDHQKVMGFNRNRNPFEIFENNEALGGQSAKKVQNLHNHSQQERNTMTPLSSAINSSQLPQKSPWEIEFLNRIRHKSTLRKHTGLHNLCAPCYGPQEARSKGTKRSPSIIELFKNPGHCASDKSFEQKKQKRFIWPSSTSKIGKNSASERSTQTPVDKKAKRKLSFATNGSGGQTKLVWCDSGSHTPGTRF